MDGDREQTTAFADTLDRFKRHGCNLLVVNDVGSESVSCTRLLGDAGERRRHLFIPTTTTLTAVLNRHDPIARNPTMLGVVDATQARRIRSNAAAPVPDTADWYEALDDLADLGQLSQTVHDHLRRFASDETTSPGEIRVCVESLDPFLDCVGVERLSQFLRSLTDRIEQFQAIGHFHLASGTSQTVVDALEPIFDATVRVRASTGDAAEQRWTLQESGLESDWLPLESHEKQSLSNE